LRWERRVARTEKIKIPYEILAGKPQGTMKLKHIGVKGRIILK
jgi:hypothetical protein